ncbi:MAG: hypothetical protein ACR2HC_02635 [Thermoleophilaceae bacterium]
MHSCCTDSAAKRAMFSEAKASGAAYIRVAFEMHGIAPDPGDSGRRYWEGPDDVAQLSREFQLPVVAVPLGVSHGESSCPDAPFAQQTLCPPRDSARWAGLLGELAARYAGVINHFEVWNEPDGAWAFRGEPEDYAWMLSRSYDAIKARAPAATVLIAGTMYPDARGNGWLDRVFATPGADAATKFDIGTVHLRGAPDQMVADLRGRQALWAKWGRRIPTWVTEHGSPSDPAFQLGAPVPSGEAAQAAYLARSLPALGLAGADQVFVTLRDEGAGEFASEGIVAGRGLPDSPFRRKLAWQTVLDATRAWPMVLALANRPQPVAFRSGFLVASARVPKAPRVEASSDRGGPLKHGRRRVMAWSRSPTTRFPVELRGRFAGSGCAGQVRLTYRLGRARPTVRIAAVDAGCRYAVNTVVRVPTTTRLPARLSIRQQFLGSETTRSGSAKPLTVKLRARPAPKLKRPRRAPSARRAAP